MWYDDVSALPLNHGSFNVLAYGSIDRLSSMQQLYYNSHECFQTCNSRVQNFPALLPLSLSLSLSLSLLVSVSLYTTCISLWGWCNEGFSPVTYNSLVCIIVYVPTRLLQKKSDELWCWAPCEFSLSLLLNDAAPWQFHYIFLHQKISELLLLFQFYSQFFFFFLFLT